MHLPPRAVIEFKLLQRGSIPLPLPGQHSRCAAIERPEGLIPLTCKDLLPELCTGCHRRSSPQTKAASLPERSAQP